MANATSGYEAFIKNLLVSKFKIPLESITLKKHTVGANNHVYMVTLSTPTTQDLAAQDGPVRPLTHPIPSGTSRLVFRIPRAESNLEESIRIRNEVSMLTLARDALADVDPSLVPRVFGWSDAAAPGDATVENPSFIIEEFKDGDVLSDKDIKDFDDETRESLFEQLARVIRAFQTYTLPKGVTRHGGVTFDDEGYFSSTKCVIRMGGPFKTYADFLKGTIMWQLQQSDAVSWLNGWRDASSSDVNLRDRIDKFIANSLDNLLSKVPDHKPSFVHGDFEPVNLHFDRSTNRLTAILDFDFGHVASPLSEPLFSFMHFQGLLPGCAEQCRERELLLAGFPAASLTDEEKESGEFKVGLAWEAALAAQNVVRPSTVENAALVSDLWWFAQELCQAYWQIPRLLQGGFAKGKEMSLRDQAAQALDKYLTQWGY